MGKWWYNRNMAGFVTLAEYSPVEQVTINNLRTLRGVQSGQGFFYLYGPQDPSLTILSANISDEEALEMLGFDIKAYMLLAGQFRLVQNNFHVPAGFGRDFETGNAEELAGINMILRSIILGVKHIQLREGKSKIVFKQ